MVNGVRLSDVSSQIYEMLWSGCQAVCSLLTVIYIFITHNPYFVTILQSVISGNWSTGLVLNDDTLCCDDVHLNNYNKRRKGLTLMKSLYVEG